MLKTQIAKNMAAVKGTPHDAEHPNPEISMVLKTLEGANTDTLLAWDKLWQEQFDAKFPSGPQSKQLGEGAVQAPPGVPGDRPPLAFDPHASLKGAI
jgi:hypothetical protein